MVLELLRPTGIYFLISVDSCRGNVPRLKNDPVDGNASLMKLRTLMPNVAWTFACAAELILETF